MNLFKSKSDKIYANKKGIWECVCSGCNTVWRSRLPLIGPCEKCGTILMNYYEIKVK
jgi:rRNA maturation endonuclease Nob1